jgi:twitching motility protein PilT
MNTENLLKKITQDDHISDLHLTVNSKPIIRYSGELKKMSSFPKKLDMKSLKNIAQELMNEGMWQEFEEKGEVDFSYSVPGVSRFRVNAYHQRSAISLALRVIPSQVPTLKELNLPQILKKLALQRIGLILCTGPTGSGKSTTLAAMINEINENKKVHILTLEDPIEYLHHHNQSIVHQREIGADTESFANGLRAALRQDPDVILVGEMRDLETISIALEAAETGHLVMATLHTNSAPQTVDRIIDVFPPHQQQQVRIQLSSVINGIVSQQLLPKANQDGRIAAQEILIGTPAVKNIIREGKSNQLFSAIQTGKKYGMIDMDNYLLNLYQNGKIKLEEALRRANNQNYIKKRARQ